VRFIDQLNRIRDRKLNRYRIETVPEMVLLHTMKHRTDLQSDAIDVLLTARRHCWVHLIEGTELRPPETTSSVNLSEVVNRAVKGTSVHDSQRINTKFDAQERIWRRSNAGCKSRFKRKRGG
jgi:hypothetical protein